MDIIDAQWVKSRLKGKHGEKSELAKFAGITPKKLSYILSGERNITQEEATKIRDFFDEPAEKPAPQPGLSEPSAAQFVPKPSSSADQLLAIAKTKTNHPVIFRLTGPLHSQGILAGDLIIVDLKGEPSRDDLVVCTITDFETGDADTKIRRFIDPFLIADTSADKIDPNTGNAAILGKVIGVVRGDFAAE